LYSKPLIFVIISALVVLLVYSSYSTSDVFALTRGPVICQLVGSETDVYECCQTETDDDGIEIQWCTMCDRALPEGSQCTERQPGRIFGALEQPPTPPPSGPSAPLQGGVLEQPPSQGVAPPLTQDQGVLPEDGVLQLPPAEQDAAELPPPTAKETQPAAVEEEQSVPVCQERLEFNEDLGFCVPTECPEGQLLDDETGICVLEEPETAEEPEEQPQGEQPQEEPDEQQVAEEDDSSEENTDDN
jgi:hypothetical protein